MKKYLLFALCLWSSLTLAAWPEKSIKIVVPYPPGGTTDIVARAIQPRLTELLKQPIIIEYTPGASGSIGADRVATTHDNYTFLLTADEFVTNGIVDPKSNHRLSNFKTVAFLAHSPIVLTANVNSPYRSAKKLLSTEKISYGNGGTRSISTLLVNKTRPEWISVSYKGGALMFADVIPGTVDIGACSVLQATTYIQSNKLAPIMVYSRTRLKALPDVPTSYELGIPLAGSVWLGVVAPTSTTDEAAHTLSIAIVKALSDPEIAQPLIDRGLTISPKGPSEFNKFIIENKKFVQELLPK